MEEHGTAVTKEASSNPTRSLMCSSSKFQLIEKRCSQFKSDSRAGSERAISTDLCKNKLRFSWHPTKTVEVWLASLETLEVSNVIAPDSELFLFAR